MLGKRPVHTYTDFSRHTKTPVDSLEEFLKKKRKQPYLFRTENLAKQRNQ